MTSTINPQIWGSPPKVLNFSTDEELRAVYDAVQSVIHKTFRLYPYNTIDTFVEFRQAYREQKVLNLTQFLSAFPINIKDDSLSCVGLSQKVEKHIAEVNPELSNYTFTVIAQEYSLDTPVPQNPPGDDLSLLHEHQMIAIEFRLKGRSGYILADVGLIIDIPVVVMRDGLHPETGVFRRLGRTGYREFCFKFNDAESSYLVWKIREYRENEIKDRKRFVYLGRPFLKSDALERRNLVYPFHGFILMEAGGLRAALYLVLGKDQQRFTLFVPDEAGKMYTVYLPYSLFSTHSFDQVNSTSNEIADIETVYRALDTFSRLCGFEGRRGIWEKFRPVSETLNDDEFLHEVISLNEKYQTSLQTALL